MKKMLALALAAAMALGAAGAAAQTLTNSCPEGCVHVYTSAHTEPIAVVGGTHNITLENVNIIATGMYDCAFALSGNAVVNLTLVGENTLTSGMYRAGLEAPAGTTLTINAESTGHSLTATSYAGAGIGGQVGGDGGTITISGGKVTAESKLAAGIGGGSAPALGSAGNGGKVTISGGKVMAKGKAGTEPRYKYCAIGGGDVGAGQGSLSVDGDEVVMKAQTGLDSHTWIDVQDAQEYRTKNYWYAVIEVINYPKADAAEPPQTADLPRTGDASMLGAWVALLAASGAALKIRRKR